MFSGNPLLKRMLIDGELTVKDLITMKEKDLASDAVKKKYADIADYKF